MMSTLGGCFNSSIGGKGKSFLLYCSGGIGKTQFASNSLKKVMICAQQSIADLGQINSSISNIFWIDASSEINIELGLMQTVQTNTAPQEARESAGSVLQCISQRTNWLMIYDGADGQYQIVERFLPPGNGGNILITSKDVGIKEYLTLFTRSLKYGTSRRRRCYLAPDSVSHT
jgi:hypothetical protein